MCLANVIVLFAPAGRQNYKYIFNCTKSDKYIYIHTYIYKVPACIRYEWTNESAFSVIIASASNQLKACQSHHECFCFKFWTKYLIARQKVKTGHELLLLLLLSDCQSRVLSLSLRWWCTCTNKHKHEHNHKLKQKQTSLAASRRWGPTSLPLSPLPSPSSSLSLSLSSLLLLELLYCCCYHCFCLAYKTRGVTLCKRAGRQQLLLSSFRIVSYRLFYSFRFSYLVSFVFNRVHS